MPKSNFDNYGKGPKLREEMTAADKAANTRLRPDVQRSWVEKINASGRGMTAWERGFVESAEEYLKAGIRLSERQAETLERIYSERTD